MIRRLSILALFLSACLVSQAQFQPTSNSFTNVYTPQTFTATAQTGTVLGVKGTSETLLSVYATTISTASFQVLGSSDNGAHYTALNVALITTPGTVSTTTTTTATSALYTMNSAGMTNIKIVTTGSFTATGFGITVTTTNSHGLL